MGESIRMYKILEVRTGPFSWCLLHEVSLSETESEVLQSLFDELGKGSDDNPHFTILPSTGKISERDVLLRHLCSLFPNAVGLVRQSFPDLEII